MTQERKLQKRWDNCGADGSGIRVRWIMGDVLITVASLR
jgi:hypothetical protein